MAIIILAFSLSLSLLDNAGEATLNNSIESSLLLNGSMGWLVGTCILTLVIFKLLGLAAIYFKRLNNH